MSPTWEILQLKMFKASTAQLIKGDFSIADSNVKKKNRSLTVHARMQFCHSGLTGKILIDAAVFKMLSVYWKTEEN
jgi:hypothetical protein